MPNSVYIRLLQRAAAILGGNEALCAFLEVPENRLRYWLEGAVTPPERVFLRLVDIVMDHDSTTRGGALQPQHSQSLHGRRDDEK